MQQPFPSLKNTRILDLTDRWGQFAAKLLTQLGADVVIGESPEGHPLRRAWPIGVVGQSEPVSMYFWHFNVGKRSATFDLSTDETRQKAAALIAAAHVVLIGASYYQQIKSELPDVFSRTHVVVVSAYGLSSPDVDRNDDLHVSARSGMAGLSGYGSDDRSAPIIPPAEQTMHSAGLYGAIAAMLAVQLGPDGPGEVFDVSAQAAAFQGTEMLFASWVYRRERLRRRGGGYATAFPTGRWQATTADGSYFYAFGLLPRTQGEWDDLRAWMRSENAIQDLDEPPYDRLENLRSRNPFDISVPGQHAAEVILAFIQSMDGERAYRQAQAIKMGWARVLQPEDTLTEEQFTYRDLFHPTAWPGSDATFLTQSLPWAVRAEHLGGPDGAVARPPLAGEHTDAVLAEWTGPAEAG
jgi:crotonobetainyl-CoA:carnitine CoA-transferase CaiB-like acyl-CoA transferase